MELDADRTLGAILDSPDTLIDAMLEIQRCVISRAEFSHWADCLRFVRTPKVNMADLQKFFARPMTLDLTGKNENPGEMNYLAVSYCWSSQDCSTEQEEQSRYTIRSSRGLRPNRAPTSVLDRSILYAAVHDIRFIWIDQECIEQDDPLDLKHGVQCMDQVYRSAFYSIGLLNTEISTQRLFETLNHLVSDKRHKVAQISSWKDSWYTHSDSQTHSEMAYFLNRLATDRWFYRNWTYQEASCAHDKMQLLIPVNKMLSGPDSRAPNEVYLRLSELWSVASRIRAAEESFDSPKLDHSGMDAMLGLCVQAWNQGRRLSRPQSFEVAKQMRIRDNSVVADRLAITANLCGYTKRLDSATMNAKKLSYSICALALALLNGTIIPSGRTNVFSSTGKPHFFWQQKTIYDFLVCPEYLSTAYANPDRLEARLADIRMTRKGLETRGWLWTVDTKVALPWVCAKYQHFLEKPTNSINITKLSPHFGVLIKDLSDGFERLNHPRIASTLFDCLTKGHLKNMSSHQSIMRDCTVDQYFPGHWIYHLVERFLQTGQFWCGSLDGETVLSSIFDCNAPTTVFTGSDVEFGNISRPWAARNFISCEVIPSLQSTEDIKELMHTMNSIHGIWHGTDALSKRYLFPWGRDQP